MKKFAILLLVFTLCIGMLAGCGDSQAPDAPTAENDTPVSTPETPEEPSEEPAPAPSEKPSEEPSEEPAPTPSEDPVEEPAPAPSEEPTEEPAPAPSEEPAEKPSEEPVPSETSSEDDGRYTSMTFYDVHNETAFTFDKAYLENDQYIHVKAGSNYTAKADSGDAAWIYGEYASYLDFAGCWMVGIDSSMGPQCSIDAPGGCVDDIFQQLTADFGENCQEGQRVLPLIQYEWEGCYILIPDGEISTDTPTEEPTTPSPTPSGSSYGTLTVEDIRGGTLTFDNARIEGNVIYAKAGSNVIADSSQAPSDNPFDDAVKLLAFPVLSPGDGIQVHDSFAYDVYIYTDSVDEIWVEAEVDMHPVVFTSENEYLILIVE